MNEDAMKELVSQYLKAVTENNGKEAERYMMMFGMEVEREVRHRAVSMAYTLAESLNIMNKE